MNEDTLIHSALTIMESISQNRSPCFESDEAEGLRVCHTTRTRRSYLAILLNLSRLDIIPQTTEELLEEYKDYLKIYPKDFLIELDDLHALHCFVWLLKDIELSIKTEIFKKNLLILVSKYISKDKSINIFPLNYGSL